MTEYLDLTFESAASTLPVRVERQAAEDDLGATLIDRETFEAWVDNNTDRIKRAALSKDCAQPAFAPGQDHRIVLRRGDLKDL
jgi:hypothetical protein